MKPTYEELQDKCAALAADNEKAMEAIRQADEVVKRAHSKFAALADENMALRSALENGMTPPETPATDAYMAEVRASAIPDGYKLVPEQMYLDAEDIQAICMQCGDGNKKGYGEFVDGIFWVGELSNDEGVIKYGLNVADANYPEEGSITVFEFAEPPFAAQLRQGAAL